MVLDVLALIKEQDEGFSYRRSCRRHNGNGRGD
jgi:succinate dehydrogenase/fumarate reductase-like Fe-S protein